MNKTPDFIVVGPPKTATTWLFKCLKEHSGIFLPEMKQCHYFDRNYDKGIQWYLDHFPNQSGEDILYGDITPDYISTIEAPKRIVDTCKPDVKIIIVHRDPIKRSHSEYLMKLRTGKVTGTFTEAIDQDPAIISNSLYHKNISEYLKFIKKENLLVVSYQTISNNPDLALKCIYTFLDIEYFSPTIIDTKINKGGTSSRFQNIFIAGITLRKKIELSNLGRKALTVLRKTGLFSLWHNLVLKKRDTKTDDKQELKQVYEKYLQGDDLKTIDKFGVDFNL